MICAHCCRVAPHCSPSRYGATLYVHKVVCPQLLLFSKALEVARGMDPQQIDFGSLAPLGELFAPASGPPPHGSGAASSADPPVGSAGDGQAATAPAGDAAGQELAPTAQVDLGEALAFEGVRTKVDRHSKEHLGRMRAAANEARVKHGENSLRGQLEEATGALQVVRALLPAAVGLFGAPPAKQLGRKRNPTPEDFTLVVRALHLPPTCRLHLGIKLDRLRHVGARLVMQRQEGWLQKASAALSAALANTHGEKAAHLSLAQMWDEVEAKFAWRPEGHRGRKGATMEQTLVQRGAAGFCLRVDGHPSGAYFAEHWLGPPLEVEGTAGAALLPGLRRFWPQAASFEGLPSLRKLVSDGAAFTFMPMCDKASGNRVLLKAWGQHWQDTVNKDKDIGKRVLYFPDVCSVHLHHRAKLQLRGLRDHTFCQCSVANLLRLRGVQVEVLGRLEKLVSERLACIVGQPPQHEGASLATMFDILFKMDDEHTDRKRGRSRRHSDLARLGRVLNGDMMDDDLKHFCWDSDEGRPCCEDRDDCVGKVVFACSCALFGDGDPSPCERRWTNLLSNMKKTLLRRCTQRIGLDAFGSALATDADGGRCGSGGELPRVGQQVAEVQDASLLCERPRHARVGHLRICIGHRRFQLVLPLLGRRHPRTQRCASEA